MIGPVGEMRVAAWVKAMGDMVPTKGAAGAEGVRDWAVVGDKPGTGATFDGTTTGGNHDVRATVEAMSKGDSVAVAAEAAKVTGSSVPVAGRAQLDAMCKRDSVAAAAKAEKAMGDSVPVAGRAGAKGTGDRDTVGAEAAVRTVADTVVAEAKAEDAVRPRAVTARVEGPVNVAAMPTTIAGTATVVGTNAWIGGDR